LSVQQLVYEDPRAPAEATRAITVQLVELTLEISPAPPYLAGQTITLTARLTVDGVPWAGATVTFYREHPPAFFEVIGSATTDADGYASLTHTIPWRTARDYLIPCHTVNFYAREPTTPVMSAPFPAAIAFPTRISISAPDTVRQGEVFTVSGVLEYESDAGVWSALADRTVEIYYNGTLAGTTTTTTDGSYSLSLSIDVSGTYTLRAYYAGEGLGLAPAFAILGLEIPSQAIFVGAPVLVGLLSVLVT